MVVNYLVKDYLTSKKDPMVVINNTTINNPETLKYVTLLNDNEVVRQVVNDIPRFGLAGKRKTPQSAVARARPPMISAPDPSQVKKSYLHMEIQERMQQKKRLESANGNSRARSSYANEEARKSLKQKSSVRSDLRLEPQGLRQ